MRFCGLVFCAFLLASPALAQEAEPEKPPEAAPASPDAAPKVAKPEKPAKPDCDGRNPYYCGIVVTNQESESDDDGEDGEIEKVLRPPGGCEGRNPKYCEELGPAETQADAEKAGVKRKDGRNPNHPSRNPNRRRGGSQ